MVASAFESSSASASVPGPPTQSAPSRLEDREAGEGAEGAEGAEEESALVHAHQIDADAAAPSNEGLRAGAGAGVDKSCRPVFSFGTGGAGSAITFTVFGSSDATAHGGGGGGGGGGGAGQSPVAANVDGCPVAGAAAAATGHGWRATPTLSAGLIYVRFLYHGASPQRHVTPPDACNVCIPKSPPHSVSPSLSLSPC